MAANKQKEVLAIAPQCDKCKKFPPRDEAIYQREYWWHFGCANIVDGIVQFPSEGKIIPATTLTEAK